MPAHPTMDYLRELGLAGMAKAVEEQRRHADAADLGFEDRLAMLVEREALERDSKRWVHPVAVRRAPPAGNAEGR